MTLLTSAAASAAVIPVANHNDLEDALWAGVSPKLTADILSPSSEVFTSGTAITLDLAGHTLTLHSLQLVSGADLTITDSSVGGTGVLTVDASDLPIAGYADSRAGIMVPAGASLEIEAGTVTAKGGGQGAAGIGAQGHGGLGASLGTVTISGGSVTAQGSNAAASIGGSAVMSGGQVIITGGTVVATSGSAQFGAAIGGGFFGSIDSVTISGGTVTATAEGFSAAIGQGDRSVLSTGAITISGGNVTATSNSGAGIGAANSGASGGAVAISGGTVRASSTGGGSGIGGVGSTRLDSVVISGGTVDASSSIIAAAIGDSGIITIGEGADVTVDSGPFSALVGSASDAAVTINGALHLASAQITAPSAGSFVIGATGVIDGDGDLAGTTTITNNGSIALPTVSATTVLNHNYLVTFEPSGDTVRVYASTFTDGARVFPSAGPWSRVQNGTQVFTLDSELTADTTLYPAVVPTTVLPSTGVDLLPTVLAALLLMLAGAVVRVRSAR